jgi:hypothetical protein
MNETNSALTVQALIAARTVAEQRRRVEAEAAAAQKKAELKAFAEKAMTYEITEEDKAKARTKIRHAFEAGENEAMLLHFPCDICTDGGRRINNHLEGWQDTLPGALKHIHDWWEEELAAGGFTFSARIIDYPGGMPGDVGIFIGWPTRVD